MIGTGLAPFIQIVGRFFMGRFRGTLRFMAVAGLACLVSAVLWSGPFSAWRQIQNASKMRLTPVTPLNPKVREATKDLVLFPTEPPEWFGVKQWGSEFNDSALGLAVDSKKNIYALLKFNKESEFGPAGIHLLKLNSRGEKEWDSLLSSDTTTDGVFCLDKEDDIFVAVNTGTAATKTRNSRIDRIDPAGKTVWSVSLEETAKGSANSIVKDLDNPDVGSIAAGDGYVFIGGAYTKSEGASVSYDDGYVAWYKMDGTYHRSIRMKQPDINRVRDIALDAKDRTLWVLGEFSGDFFKLASLGGDDLYLQYVTYANDLDNTNFAPRRIGTPKDDMGNALSVYKSGLNGVLIAGATEGDLAGSNKGNFDGFWGLHDTELKKSVDVGSSGQDLVSDITSDADGDVYVVGSTTNLITSGYKANDDHTYDAFMIKYDPSFKEAWAYHIGAGNKADDHADAVAVDQEQNVYVLGTTAGSMEGQQAFGNNDVFLKKVKPGGFY